MERILLLATMLSVPVTPWSLAGQDGVPAPDTTDRALVQIVAAALVSADETAIWPGYRLGDFPLLVYRPETWAVLVDPPPEELAGWSAYPGRWPDIGRPARFHQGGVEGLVGQLAFDYQIGGKTGVAVPLFAEIPPGMGQRDRQLLAFLTHETFHQYQRAEFGELDTPSEEAYPMLDAQNNALAAIELKAIQDALQALSGGDHSGTREAAERAVSVHGARWTLLDSTAQAIERAKEIVEGTAKYVEARSVEAFARACEVKRAHRAAFARLCDRFEGMDAASWLLTDIRGRFEGDAISPQDMPRNRLYPVAAGVGLLLDRFAPEWKGGVQAAGTASEHGLFELLQRALEGPADPGARLAEARARYDWDGALAAAHAAVSDYRRGFGEALAEFRAVSGTRVVVEAPVADVVRSRSSREQRWVMDQGRRTLGSFVIYTLRRRGEHPFAVSLRDKAVLDEIRGDGRRRVTAHVPGELRMRLDGQPAPPDRLDPTRFGSLTLEGEGLDFDIGAPGRIRWDAGTLWISIEELGE